MSAILVFTAVSSLQADAVQDAARRVDAGLMRDYQDAQADWEKRYNRPLPALPGVADDAAFLRRACVGLAGRLPRAEEVRDFLADNTIGKRGRLTDALVKEPGAAEVRFRMLAEAFRVKDDAEMVAWLRQAAAEDNPLDQLIAWWVGGRQVRRRDEENPLRSAVEIASAVLGEDLYCSMCHDHPFNSHTQRETYEFAACFAENGTVRLPKDYRYLDGKPGEVVKPQFIRYEMQNKAQQTGDLVKWLTARSNPRFDAVAALRVWAGLFGQSPQFVDRTLGGVDAFPGWHDIHPKPLNNMTSSNCFGPPDRDLAITHWLNYLKFSEYPGAVRAMAEEFRRCGMRIGEFQRILASTNAYSRASFNFDHRWNGMGYIVPAPQVRRLPSELIWAVISGEKDTQMPQVPPAGHPLRLLGRGTREWEDESCTPLSHELVRFMMNSEHISQAAEKAGEAEAIFIDLLGREVTQHERTVMARAEASPQDVAWALLNSKEFMFTR
ncbi:MAG: DUF1549 domain-containing protein [Verrucomicrobiaceae bacterium]|nr:DUF1549 domain-containing protein [Verrucomicrobiaceae bacterium]